MNGTDHQELLKAGSRCELSPEEAARLQERLSRHPEEKLFWEDELRLNELLRRLPEVPVSSNFTALVLQEARRQPEARPERPWWRRLPKPHWSAPWKTATAALLLMGVGLTYHQHQLSTRAELARNLAAFSQVADLPSIELLKDFEAIQHLHVVPGDVDLELLLALQDL
jgi:anti-sigma factor RsiW